MILISYPITTAIHWLWIKAFIFLVITIDNSSFLCAFGELISVCLWLSYRWKPPNPKRRRGDFRKRLRKPNSKHLNRSSRTTAQKKRQAHNRGLHTFLFFYTRCTVDYLLYIKLLRFVVSLIAWLDNLQMYFASLVLSLFKSLFLILSALILPYLRQPSKEIFSALITAW